MPHRPVRDPFVGPLGGWELTRLARRGQVTHARLLVLYLLLLIAFVLTPLLWFATADPVRLFTGTGQTLAPHRAAAFANRFALVLMETVLLAVAAMTPGYAAAAVAEEKERQTLQLLLTTSLSDREVVLGKAASRLGFVLAAAAAGLPVLAATTLFGGVDVWFLLAGCVLTVSTAALATAVGLHAACVAPDLRGALVRAYGMAAVVIGGGFIPPVVLLTPFAALAWLASDPGGLGQLVAVGLAYPAAQSAVAAWFFADAIRQIRTGHAPPPPAVAPSAAAPLPEWSVRPWEVASLPPVDESAPLLWKERHVTGRPPAGPGAGDGVRLLGWGFGAVAGLLMIVGGTSLLTRTTRQPGDGRVLMTAGTVAAGLFLVPTAVGLAATVARERHRQTLDALLALPVDRRAVLRAKARAVLERVWVWEVAAVLATGLSFGADGGLPLGLAAAGFALAGAGLVVGLGGWLTVRCPTEVRAIRLLAPAVVLVVGVPVFAWNQTDWNRPGDSATALAAGAVALAGSGTVLWWQAGRGFDRLG